MKADFGVAGGRFGPPVIAVAAAQNSNSGVVAGSEGFRTSVPSSGWGPHLLEALLRPRANSRPLAHGSGRSLRGPPAGR